MQKCAWVEVGVGIHWVTADVVDVNGLNAGVSKCIRPMSLCVYACAHVWKDIGVCVCVCSYNWPWCLLLRSRDGEIGSKLHLSCSSFSRCSSTTNTLKNTFRLFQIKLHITQSVHPASSRYKTCTFPRMWHLTIVFFLLFLFFFLAQELGDRAGVFLPLVKHIVFSHVMNLINGATRKNGFICASRDILTVLKDWGRVIFTVTWIISKHAHQCDSTSARG